jgi:perosamine synthetase
MDLDAARRAITPRTRAVVVVHLYGKPDPAAESDLFRGFRVVEDCAEAHGAMLGDRSVGSIGAAGSWSFYGNKIAASGEGGAVTTSDSALAARMCLLRGQGVDPDRRFVAVISGHNWRMTNTIAAIACAQIERMPRMLQQRRHVAAWYREELGGMLFDADRPGAVTWLVNARVGDGAAVALRMAERGVETRPWFPPLHSMPAFSGYDYIGDEAADRIHREVISLPTSSTMDRQTVAAVCAALKESL